MRVLAVDPQPGELPPGVNQVYPPEELDACLAESDVVVVAAPHTPETDGLFCRPRFQAMKPSAFFINVGRGAIVDLDDLVQALDAREIAGAALDVCDPEPLPPIHTLWKRNNVIITPHVAAMSPRIAERHLALLVDNVERFISGRPLRNVVDKSRWY